jgi:hypothetical protein
MASQPGSGVDRTGEHSQAPPTASSSNPAVDEWPRFLKYAAYVRNHRLFDAIERDRKLEIAGRLRQALESVRQGGEWFQHLDAVLCKRIHYILPVPHQYDWLSGWASSYERSAQQALTGFLDLHASPETRLARFASAARADATLESDRDYESVLALGSLFNFAAEPHELPVIRRGTPVFDRLERILGHETLHPGDSIEEQYARHLAFARDVEARLKAEKFPVTDMLDVQPLIFIGSQDHQFWRTEVEESPAAAPRPESAPRETRPPARPYLSICACLGYDAPYLVEWIEFHRVMGVERFFLYNNGDREVQAELLKPYVEEGVVVLYDWPGPRPQRRAFDHCLNEHRGDSRWIAFIDTDEFVFSPTGRALPEVLAGYAEAAAVGVNLSVFGTSGHRTKPSGLLIENYLLKHPLGDRHIKSIVDPQRVVRSLSEHTFVFDDALEVDENGDPIWRGGGRTCYTSCSRLRINHYRTKSAEEWRVKLSRPRPDTDSPYREPDFSWLGTDDARFLEADHAITRWVPAVRDAVAAREKKAGRAP